MEQFDSSVEESSKVSEQQQRNDEQQLLEHAIAKAGSVCPSICLSHSRVTATQFEQ